MMMDLAVGHGANLPGKRSRSGNVHLARSIEEVGLDGVIGRIEHAHAVGNDRVSVIIRSERIGGHTPDALIVFLHGERLGIAFEGNDNFFVVGGAKVERNAFIGVDLVRDQRWLWRLRWSDRGQEQNGKHKKCSFHDSSSRRSLMGALISERLCWWMIQHRKRLKVCKVRRLVCSEHPHPPVFSKCCSERTYGGEVPARK